MRSVLMRSSMQALKDLPKAQWRLRDHANIIIPSSRQRSCWCNKTILFGSTRVSLRSETELRLVTLAPISRLKDDDYWEKNHRITSDTLNEDFVLGESIQESLETGANEHMTFGRFEGALLNLIGWLSVIPRLKPESCARVSSRSNWSEKCFLSARLKADGPLVCSPEERMVSIKSRICSRCLMLFSVYRSPRGVNTNADLSSTSDASGISAVITKSPSFARRSISLSASSKPLGT